MSTLTASLVRIIVMGAALAAYYVAIPHLLPDDDGLGAGLIAFGALVLTSFGWSLIDGRARGAAASILIWAIVAAIFSIGWLVVLSITGADASMSATELMVHDAPSLPFTTGLVLVPAAIGSFVGAALRPTNA